MHFEAIRSERGCVSYLIGCEKMRAAIVVDPSDEQIDRYLALAASHGLRIRYLLDTHTHADHFSAVSELRDQLGVPTIMHRSSPAPFIDAPRFGGALSLGPGSPQPRPTGLAQLPVSPPGGAYSRTRTR